MAGNVDNKGWTAIANAVSFKPGDRDLNNN